MKKLFAVSTIALMGAVAFAGDMTDLSFRFGVVKPTDSGVPTSQFTSFGLQHKVRAISSNENWNNFGELSVDFYGKGDYRSIPFLYNYVAYSTKSDFFLSLGAGVSFITRPDATGTESVGRFAYQVGLGYNLTKGENSSFVEAKFMGNGASELNGFGVFFGVRF